ncbi:MAG: sugar kinase [Tissierellia bacterium]|nr:sugar kinase [Tissierellia bacterium]
MAKTVTLGEIMLRLSTPNYKRFVQADSFDVVYGGGEANVAVSLSNYGHKSYFVSKVPENPIGQAAVNHLRRYGVSEDYILRGGDRLGIYYLETGASMRPSKVVYDRANSAFSLSNADEYNWDEIFKDCSWFHFSGITPALGEDVAKLTKIACQEAKKRDVMISVDLNYRANLWSPEQAQKVMTDLMQYVDVCIGNEEDAELTLGFKPGNTDVVSGDLELEGYKNMFKQMKEKYDFKLVVSSLRVSHSASDNGWSACAYDGKDFYHSKEYQIRLVDRVGGGDSFAAGLIHGLLRGDNFKNALEFAVAASALKQTIPGDFNMVSEAEVEKLKGGDASGRVQR